MKTPGYVFVAFICMLLTSCKTYQIPVSDFRQMFAGKTLSRTVTTSSPFGGTTTYATYPISYIKCVDKKGKAAQLKNAPSVEMRVTDTNNKKTIFYFDLVEVKDSVIKGGMSRIMPSFKKTIPLGKIKKIEVQDGGKKYQYVKIID